MWSNSVKLGLAAALLFLAASPAPAQGLRDAQIFAPVDNDTFGGGVRANEGYFFTFDGLMWWISQPDKTTVGSPGLTRTVEYYQVGGAPVLAVQENNEDTGFIQAEQEGGNRYDFGHVSGHHGWLASIFRLSTNNQVKQATEANVVFSDPPFGPEGAQWLDGYVEDLQAPLENTLIGDLPLTFPDLTLHNRSKLWGAELNYMYRMHPNHHGGIFEWYFGARYMEFDDFFNADAPVGIDADEDGAIDFLGNSLGPGFWHTRANNRVVGPQVALRWFRQVDRLSLSAQGKFFAGYNSQSIRQRTSLGSELRPPAGSSTIVGPVPGLPLAMGPSNYNHVEHAAEWSPAGEVRLDLSYQLTRAVSMQVGWTGIWMDGIARASNMVVYELPGMGIDMAHNRQGSFINGVNIGVLVNR